MTVERGRRRPSSGALLGSAALLATLLPGGQALRDGLATWSAAPVGSARASAQVVPAGSVPSTTVSGRDVSVSWAPTVLSGGTPASGYVVARYDANGIAVAVGAGCTGVVTAASCVERAVPDGIWRYGVTPQRGSWTGPAGPRSPAFTVGSATFSLDAPTTVSASALPYTFTGTIANFAPGTALSFHLDSPSGPVLGGSPATVPSGGSGGVSVTVPAGTDDSAHSIFATDAAGSLASAAFIVLDPPVLTALSMSDVDSNGKVDRVTATFSKTLAPYSAGTGPWTLAGAPSGATLSAVSVSGSTATLALAEGAGAATTATGSFTVALAANSSGIRDLNNQPASFPAQAPADAAAPAATAVSLLDTTGNGRVDQVTAVFSEALAPYTAGGSPWSAPGVPSGGSLASVAVAASTATLTLTEGAGAQDTAVGSMTVALAADPAGVRDAAGNLASFAARTPVDKAKPVPTAHVMGDVNADGKVDQVADTFSEPLAAYSAGSAPWSLASVPSGGTLASVAVSGSTATLTLNQGAGTPSTAVGSFKVTLAANVAGVRDVAGNLSSYAATAPTDGARPVLRTLSLLDNSKNGRVDRVTALFSETLAAYSAGTSPWTLANVPSNGSIASVTVATATATILMTEGTGAQDTTVGTMTVALAGNAAGVRDVAGNLSSFAATTPLDKAGPAPIAVRDTNGATDGLIEVGDTIAVDFSEPLAPAAVPSTTTVTESDPGTGSADQLAITGITNGARNTNGSNYVTLSGASAGFAASTVALSNSNKTLTVTVGGSCSGTGCAALGQATSATSLSFVPALTLTDVSGNAAGGTKSQSLRLF